MTKSIEDVLAYLDNMRESLDALSADSHTHYVHERAIMKAIVALIYSSDKPNKVAAARLYACITHIDRLIGAEPPYDKRNQGNGSHLRPATASSAAYRDLADFG
jgi:hypothetical protein